MAIDTAAKRFSVIRYTVAQPPRPDLFIAANDRATLVGDYSGLYGDGSGGSGNSGVAASGVLRLLTTTPNLGVHPRRRGR